MRRSTGFILKSLLVSMLVSMALILAASTASAYTPNDPYWGSQWGPNKIYAPDAWDYQKGSTTVTVAILDTGIDYNHEDLSGRVIQGWNFYNNSNAVMDDNSKSHGTRIAGISGAVINNSKGIAGIAQTNLLAVKVCNFMQNCTWPAITDGIYYAANNGSKIISMSLQKDDYDLDAERAVDYAYNTKGALLVGISGNGFNGTGENIIKYPGNFSNVIAVGATDSNDSRASFSNYGSKLELVAPGVDIFSTIRNNGYAGGATDGSGTSYAAPHVAGVAALVWSQNPTLCNIEVRQILTNTAVDLGDAGRDIYYGYGKVNAYGALYLSGWDYRKQKNITGSTAGAQTNYQMKLTIYNSTGTDTPGNIYLGGNIRSDFGDLRFTKSDGVTLLDYWIESYTSGVNATVLVEIGYIPASPNTASIYIYYGNPSATSASSGLATFDFFDDFNDNALDAKWTVKWGNSGNIAEKLQELYLTSDTDNTDTHVQSSTYTRTRPFAIDYTLTPTSGTGGWVAGLLYSGNTITSGYRLIYYNGGGYNLYVDHASQGSQNGASDLSFNNAYSFTIALTNNSISIYRDGVQKGSWSNSLYQNIKVGLGRENWMQGHINNYRVRSYVNPEPTWGA